MKIKVLLLITVLQSSNTFAQQLNVDADKMLVGAQLIPVPSLKYTSKISDEEYSSKKIHYIDRTYWAGMVGSHMNDVSPDTYCNLHLEDASEFQLHGARKKHVKKMPYRDVVTYANDGAHHTLVITKVLGVRNEDNMLDEVTYYLRQDLVSEKGIQSVGQPTGYLKCYRGFGLWLFSENLKISNVMHQFGGLFELH
jgi:hypothetical protein